MNKLNEMYDKIKVFYGDYKENYTHNLKGEYDKETKKIEVYILKDKYLTEAAKKLEKKLDEIYSLDIDNAEKTRKGKAFLNRTLSNEYHVDPVEIVKRLKEIR